MEKIKEALSLAKWGKGINNDKLISLIQSAIDESYANGYGKAYDDIMFI